MGKLQRKALALSNEDEAVSLNRKGWSGEAIEAHLPVNTKTAQNYLKRFLAVESRYGLEITADTLPRCGRKQATQNTAAKKQASQEDVDSDYLFCNSFSSLPFRSRVSAGAP